MHTIGVVPYLNAVPLVADLPKTVRVVEAVPSELSALLEGGSVDAALLPVAEAIRGVGDGFLGTHGIASEGQVRSVLLFVPLRPARQTCDDMANAPPESWPRRVVLDPASRTSVALLSCLCAGVWKIDPVAETAPGPGPDPRAYGDRMTLVIGDRAMEHGRDFPGLVVDLGAAWTAWTGLPFVYAAWTARKGLSEVARGELAGLLDDAAARGLARRAELARDHGPLHGVSERDAWRYFTRFIRYEIGPREQAGLSRFASEMGAFAPAARLRAGGAT